MGKQLQDLEPGDAVAYVQYRGRSPRPEVIWVRAIERVTKTQIVIDGHRYSRHTGDPIPKRRGGWWKRRLVPATDRIKNAKEHHDLLHTVYDRIERHRRKLSGLSIAKLTRIRDAFDSEDA